MTACSKGPTRDLQVRHVVGVVVCWVEEADSMDVLGVHGGPTRARGASGEARVAVIVGKGEK